MNKLLNEIHQAQVRAGELVVIEHLAQITGLRTPIPSEHADDIAVDKFAAAMKVKMAACRAKGYGGWDDPEQCSIGRLQIMLADYLDDGDPVDIGNFAMMLFNRDARTTCSPFVFESRHAEALADDLQFDIDVASALAHAENAQDAARYHWVLPILTGSDDADKRTVLFAMQLLKGLDGDAAVDAAMKAHNEN